MTVQRICISLSSTEMIQLFDEHTKYPDIPLRSFTKYGLGDVIVTQNNTPTIFVISLSPVDRMNMLGTH